MNNDLGVFYSREVKAETETWKLPANNRRKRQRRAYVVLHVHWR